MLSFIVIPNSVTPWTVIHQVSLSMGFSRQEYWSGLTCLSPGNLPDPGMEPTSLISPALAGGFFITSATWEIQLGVGLSFICFLFVLLSVFSLFFSLFIKQKTPIWNFSSPLYPQL